MEHVDGLLGLWAYQYTIITRDSHVVGWYLSHDRFDSYWRWYNGIAVFFHF